MSDAVQTYLAQRGCPDFVVEGGLKGLVASWEAFAAGLANGYEHGLDEYLNDLDVRQILADAWPKASPQQRGALAARLETADRRVRSATTIGEACLWGAKVAKRNRYDATTNWWYYAVPKKGSAELRADLDARG